MAAPNPDDKKIIFSMVGVSKTYPPQKQVLKNIYLSFSQLSLVTQIEWTCSSKAMVS